MRLTRSLGAHKGNHGGDGVKYREGVVPHREGGRPGEEEQTRDPYIWRAGLRDTGRTSLERAAQMAAELGQSIGQQDIFEEEREVPELRDSRRLPGFLHDEELVPTEAEELSEEQEAAPRPRATRAKKPPAPTKERKAAAPRGRAKKVVAKDDGVIDLTQLSD